MTLTNTFCATVRRQLPTHVPWQTIFLVGIIAVMSIALFFKLHEVPSGFYIDEAAGAINSICLAELGQDAWHGHAYPLYFPADTGGMHSPPFVYLQALWGSIFGFHIYSLRALAACSILITSLCTSLIAIKLFNRSACIWTLAACSLSPLAFQFGRIAWDSCLYPLGTMLGILLLLSSHQWLRLLSALPFAIAAYAYGSGRVQVPLVLIGCFVFNVTFSHRSIKEIITIGVFFVILCIPMIHALFYGALADRAAYVSIFAPHFREQAQLLTAPDYLRIYVLNVLKHFSPQFLFTVGDSINLRHGTQNMGILSPLSTVLFALSPLSLFLAWKRQKNLLRKDFLPSLFLLLWGVHASIAPAALTWDSLPHALRASGVWPFVALLSGVSASILCKALPKMRLLLPIVAATSAAMLLYSYFIVYPERSQNWFDFQQLQSARKAAAQKDWSQFNVPAWYRSLERYYRHQLNQEKCLDTGP